MNAADIIATVAAGVLVAYSFHKGHKEGGPTGGLVLLVAVGSHLFLAALSAAEIALPLADDGLAFHRQALEFLAGFRILPPLPTSHLWSYGLSYLYAPLGPSVWLGYVVNQWIYLAAMLQLLRFAEEIGAGRVRWKIVLIFSLLPPSLLYCNFLFRESFQLLLLILAIRHLERYRRRGRLKSLLYAALAFVPFGAIHNAFFLFAPIAITGAVMARAFFAPRTGTTRSTPVGRILSVVFGLVVIAISVAAVGSFEDNKRLTLVLEDDIDVTEGITRSAERGARTVLPWGASPGIAGTLASGPVLLIQFLFAPVFPFLISALQDLVAAADTLLRVLFLVMAFRVYLRGTPDQRRMMVFLLGIYFAFSLIAAVGTTTVGTAMRHHLKVFWIIIAIGTPALFAHTKPVGSSQRQATRVRGLSRPPARVR